MEIFEIKKQLRKTAKDLRSKITDDVARKMSECACRRLIECEEFDLADILLIYYPIKNEISPLPLIEAARTRGKHVAFPLCVKEQNTLTFKFADVTELVRSDFGLFEPQKNAESAEPTEKTLCIVPALMFSKNGIRLGYGGGYYDRFLKDFSGKKIGLSYSSLLVDKLDREEHDIPLDMIITESEVLRIAQKDQR